MSRRVAKATAGEIMTEANRVMQLVDDVLEREWNATSSLPLEQRAVKRLCIVLAADLSAEAARNQLTDAAELANYHLLLEQLRAAGLPRLRRAKP